MQRSGNGEEEKYSRCFSVGACGVRMPFVCAIQFLTTLIRIPTYIVADLFQGFAKIMVMAVLLVFGVMAATYESFKAPFINLMTIPFLAIGVVLIYKITGQSFSLLSAVGLVMLVGIVVNNGIILVDYTNLLVGRGVPLKDACYQAGKSRFRPVLMTTLTTILGMLPMCFASGGQAEMVQPIALAVVGGLISSTFITLLVIPVLYSLVMKSFKKTKRMIKLEGIEYNQKETVELNTK